ncbi:MAG TPA: PP2C family protein-serine/threonine phosphatase [Acidobacteriaceae bacterium]|nr:PP2C family protein-serine/threonine phosphatase [Acidobacteriaceae bacterium]
MMSRLLRGKWWLAVLCLAIGPALVAHAAPTAPFTVEGLGKATVALDGDWQFRPGDNPAWASPTLDDSAWEQIKVDKPWGAQTHFGYTGYGWYRRHLKFVSGAGIDSELALLLPRIDDAYEVYWNGNLLGRHGKLPPHPVWYGNIGHPILGFGKPTEGVLAIRVWKAPYLSSDTGEEGGLYGAPIVGTTQAIQAYRGSLGYRWLSGQLFFFAVDLLYLLILVIGLVAWLRNRDQKVLLWLSLWACAFLLSTLLRNLRIPWPFAVSNGLGQSVLALADVSMWYLLLNLLELNHHRFLPRWTRVLAWIAIASGVLDGFVVSADMSGPHVQALQIADALISVPATLVEVWPLVLVCFAIGKRLDTARWVMAIIAALTELTIGIANLSGQGARFTHWTLGQRLFMPLFTVAGTTFALIPLLVIFLLLAVVFAVYRYTVAQSVRQVALEQEFRSAQELQQVLIPETLPALEGYAVTSAYRPAQQVGGDFFQMIARPDGSALLVVGDVSGKGLKAAMTVSLIVGAIRTVADTIDDPSGVLSVLNRRLHGRLKDGFVTCLALRLDAEGECAIANAGHPAPFLNAEEMSLKGALPLGLDPDSAYEQIHFRLAVGERLTLYTDGVPEARNSAGDLFGFDRVRSLIATQPDARQTVEAAVAFGQDDDITVITLTRLAPGVESTTSLLAPALVSSSA